MNLDPKPQAPYPKPSMLNETAREVSALVPQALNSKPLGQFLLFHIRKPGLETQSPALKHLQLQPRLTVGVGARVGFEG